MSTDRADARWSVPITKSKKQPQAAPAEIAQHWMDSRHSATAIIGGSKVTVYGATKAEAAMKIAGMQDGADERIRAAHGSSSWQALEKAKQRASAA